MKITIKFHYDGKIDNHLGSGKPGVCGLITFTEIERLKDEAERNNHWWNHYNPTHSIEAWDKKELWQIVKDSAEPGDTILITNNGKTITV